jgi:hypothetical protein
MFSAITRVKLEKKMCFMPNAFQDLSDFQMSCPSVEMVEYLLD